MSSFFGGDPDNAVQPRDGGITLVVLFNVVVFGLALAFFLLFWRLRNTRLYLSQVRHLKLFRTYFQWIPAAVFADEETVAERAGFEGVMYLRLYRYGVVFGGLVTVLVVVVVLPFNLFGNQDSPGGWGFLQTTGTNVSAGSSTLYVHTLVAVVVLVLAWLFVLVYQWVYFRGLRAFALQDQWGVNYNTVKVRDMKRHFTTLDLKLWLAFKLGGEAVRRQLLDAAASLMLHTARNPGAPQPPPPYDDDGGDDDGDDGVVAVSDDDDGASHGKSLGKDGGGRASYGKNLGKGGGGRASYGKNLGKDGGGRASYGKNLGKGGDGGGGGRDGEGEDLTAMVDEVLLQHCGVVAVHLAYNEPKLFSECSAKCKALRGLDRAAYRHSRTGKRPKTRAVKQLTLFSADVPLLPSALAGAPCCCCCKQRWRQRDATDFYAAQVTKLSDSISQRQRETRCAEAAAFLDATAAPDSDAAAAFRSHTTGIAFVTFRSAASAQRFIHGKLLPADAVTAAAVREEEGGGGGTGGRSRRRRGGGGGGGKRGLPPGGVKGFLASAGSFLVSGSSTLSVDGELDYFDDDKDTTLAMDGGGSSSGASGQSRDADNTIVAGDEPDDRPTFHWDDDAYDVHQGLSDGGGAASTSSLPWYRRWWQGMDPVARLPPALQRQLERRERRQQRVSEMSDSAMDASVSAALLDENIDDEEEDVDVGSGKSGGGYLDDDDDDDWDSDDANDGSSRSDGRGGDVEGEEDGAGMATVTTALLKRRVKAVREDTKHWTVKMAAQPYDLRWPGLRYGRKQQFARSVPINLFVVFTAFFWAVPASLLSTLSTMAALPVVGGPISAVLDAMGPFLVNVVEGFVPPLLFLVADMMMPHVFKILTSYEKPHSRSQWDFNTMKKYFLFIFLNNLVFPSIFMGGISALVVELTDVYNSEGDGEVEVGLEYINHSIAGAFFINFLIGATFVGKVFSMYMMGDVLRTSWRRLRAVTPAQRELVWILGFFRGGWCYGPDGVIVFGLIVSYSVIVPLIAPAAVLFLAMTYALDKCQITLAKPKNFNNAARHIPYTCLFLLLSIGWGQLAFLIFLYLKQAPILCVLLWLVTFVVTVAVSVLVGVLFHRHHKTMHFLNAMTALHCDDVVASLEGGAYPVEAAATSVDEKAERLYDIENSGDFKNFNDFRHRSDDASALLPSTPQLRLFLGPRYDPSRHSAQGTIHRLLRCAYLHPCMRAEPPDPIAEEARHSRFTSVLQPELFASAANLQIPPFR